MPVRDSISTRRIFDTLWQKLPLPSMKSNVYEVIYTAEAQSVFIDSEKKRTFESSTSNCVEIVEGLFFLLRQWKKKEYRRRDKVKNRREMQVE